jgi:hypothetical protein
MFDKEGKSIGRVTIGVLDFIRSSHYGNNNLSANETIVKTVEPGIGAVAGHGSSSSAWGRRPRQNKPATPQPITATFNLSLNGLSPSAGSEGPCEGITRCPRAA